MVNTAVLFDTNILIDYLRGSSEARAELDRYTDRAISLITWMEVMAGATRDEEAAIRTFLASFATLPVNDEIAERAVAIRKARRLKLPDAIIKATAEHARRLLLTRNTRDFPANTAGVLVPYQRAAPDPAD